MTYVVLVTGSRTWWRKREVWRVLDAVAERVGWDQIVIRHGDAGGTDHWAHEWVGMRGLGDENEDAMPADWDAHGRGAGAVRNRDMIKKEPVPRECHAFLMPCDEPGCRRAAEGPHWTHGADDCATEAEKAGIPVEPHYGEL